MQPPSSKNTGPTSQTSATSETSPAELWPTPTVFGNYSRKETSAKSGDGLETAVKRPPTPEPTDFATSLQADFLVNLSALPGSAEAQAMTARSGRKCLESLPKRHPLLSLLRTFLESSTWNSIDVYLIWKASVTPHGRRLLFQLAPWTPNTGETAFGLWPTPTSRDWKDGTAEACRNVPTNSLLARTVHIHPTPDADTTSRPGGSLNPQFVEWLMGYPLEWTALSASEMQLYRRSRRKSSSS